MEKLIELGCRHEVAGAERRAVRARDPAQAAQRAGPRSGPPPSSSRARRRPSIRNLRARGGRRPASRSRCRRERTRVASSVRTKCRAHAPGRRSSRRSRSINTLHVSAALNGQILRVQPRAFQRTAASRDRSRRQKSRTSDSNHERPERHARPNTHHVTSPPPSTFKLHLEQLHVEQPAELLTYPVHHPDGGESTGQEQLPAGRVPALDTCDEHAVPRGPRALDEWPRAAHDRRPSGDAGTNEERPFHRAGVGASLRPRGQRRPPCDLGANLGHEKRVETVPVRVEPGPAARARPWLGVERARSARQPRDCTISLMAARSPGRAVRISTRTSLAPSAVPRIRAAPRRISQAAVPRVALCRSPLSRRLRRPSPECPCIRVV